jgi:PEP-CTERM motif-containing protein
MRVSSAIRTALMFAAVAFASNAQASPIRYELTGTGTGKIGNTSFTDANIDMVAIGDTANVVSIVNMGLTFYATPFSTFTIAIGGIGTATITDISELFVIPQAVPGFTTVPGVVFGRTDNPPDLTGITGIGFNVSNALAGYTGATGIGPITDKGAFGFIQGCSTPGHDSCIHTSLGLLSFSSNPNTPQDVTSQTTFTAATVPEPATLFLFGTGAAALFGRRSRARRAKRM